MIKLKHWIDRIDDILQTDMKGWTCEGKINNYRRALVNLKIEMREEEIKQ